MKYSVLIIDDNVDWCEQLAQHLKGYFEFDVVAPLHNGKDAIHYIENFLPSVIILDIIMPEYDGLYVINHIRNKIPEYNPFIYVVSAIGSEKTNQLMQKLDVDYYSVRPIKPKAVAANLQSLLVYHNMSAGAFADPIKDVDVIVEDLLYQLGGPLYMIATKTTSAVLMHCLRQGSMMMANLKDIYQEVAGKALPNSTPASLERNIRSTVKYMQRNNTPLFQEIYGETKITNQVFVDRFLRLVRDFIRENYGDKVYFAENRGSGYQGQR